MPTTGIYRTVAMRAVDAIAWPAQDAPDVSPTPKTTDISKISLTAPMAAALIVAVAAIVGAFWQLRGVDSAQMGAFRNTLEQLQSRLSEREASESKLDELNQKYLDQRFAALEAKIDAAGLRNANMALAQELQKQRAR